LHNQDRAEHNSALAIVTKTCTYICICATYYTYECVNSKNSR